jgi:hypothetical protein
VLISFLQKNGRYLQADSNEKWIIDINFTDEGREQAIKAYISILKKLGIEKNLCNNRTIA